MDVADLKARTPFEGFPRTIVLEDCDDGAPIKHIVTPRFQGPWLARVSDLIKWTLSIATAGGALYAGLHYDAPAWATMTGLVAAPSATFAASHFGLPKIITRSGRVIFTPEHFVHFGLIKVHKFDRSLPHSFALFNHHKAEREEERLSFKESKRAGKWWAWSPKRYYGNSYYVAFQYMGQRHDLMVVHKHKIAAQILARLKACDDAMEAKVGGGRGQALKPEDEWSDQPGNLDSPDLFGEFA